jgi:hypothetical protein
MNTRSRLPLFLLLALALLFTQQGAAVHALSHLSERLSSQSQQDKQLPHSSACDKCVVYAGAGAALAPSALAIPAVAAQTRHPALTRPALLSRMARPYHARAPPISV